jgi:anthranilate phosphoribosyltransferase
MKISSAINHLLEGLDLAPEAMSEIMRHIMSGAATPAQIGGFLIALRAKGESVTEVVAAAQALLVLIIPAICQMFMQDRLIV